MALVGVTGVRHGWVVGSVVLGTAAVGLTATIQAAVRWRRAAVVVALALGVAAGVWSHGLAPPMPGRIGALLDRVDLPQGMTLDQEQAFGIALCFDSCPGLVRRYRRERAVRLDEVRRAFLAAGFARSGTAPGERLRHPDEPRIEVTISEEGDTVTVLGLAER